MAEKSEGGQLPVDPPKAGDKTNYMILWAPVPDEGEPLKWREIGWYEAHSMDAAKLAAREDTDSGVYGQLLDVARPGNRGFVLRAVASRAWPEEIGDVYLQETSWATKPYGPAGKAEA